MSSWKQTWTVRWGWGLQLFMPSITNSKRRQWHLHGTRWPHSNPYNPNNNNPYNNNPYNNNNNNPYNNNNNNPYNSSSSSSSSMPLMLTRLNTKRNYCRLKTSRTI